MNDSLMLFVIILLAASTIIVPITARLGLGAVIGYLLAGVALGPQGLKLVDNPELILHYSEFGVVLLLFIIGMELKPNRLWEMRRAIFGMGSLQILLTSILISGGLLIFNWPWPEALVAGLGLSLSSTAMAMQIISEKGLRNHATGRNGFAVLLFQDLAFIPILLLMSLLNAKAVANDTVTIFTQVGTALAAVASIVIAVRYLSYPFFRWISGAHVRELSIAFSLLIVLGIAYVMDLVGVSMALGTFIAGVILADSEYRHEVEANIEPFKGLLLGLFFLAVGMSIRLDLVTAQPLTILACLVALLALKIAALVVVALVFKQDRKQIPLFAILLSQGGEFAFVLFGQALTERTLSPDRAALLNAVVTLSMLTTPLLVLLFNKLLAPRFGEQKPEADKIEHDGRPVIVAGFGRMGQIVTRILNANRITTTVIDYNPEQVERVRKFGLKAYYGDASQMGILEAAGIHQAKLLVITMSHPEPVNNLVEAVKRAYPNLEILVCARDRIHAYQLMDRGVKHFERATFGSALSMGEKALRIMGVPAFRAHRTVLKFKHYDLASLNRLYKYHKDEKAFISQSREAAAALERLFAEDTSLTPHMEDEAW